MKKNDEICVLPLITFLSTRISLALESKKSSLSQPDQANFLVISTHQFQSMHTAMKLQQQTVT